MRLYLIRHPEPTGALGLCYGRRELTLEPHALSTALEGVRAVIPAAVLADGHIYSSPASRCRQLADALAPPRVAMVAVELAEMDFGSWEGLPWNEVPRAELDAWAGNLWSYRPGGGESAEMVAARWRRFVQARRAEGASELIAVTHAGLIRVARACLGGQDLNDLSQRAIPFGAVVELDVEAAELA